MAADWPPAAASACHRRKIQGTATTLPCHLHYYETNLIMPCKVRLVYLKAAQCSPAVRLWVGTTDTLPHLRHTPTMSVSHIG